MKPNANKKRPPAEKAGAGAGKTKQSIEPNKNDGGRMEASSAGGSFGARDLQQPINPNKTGGVS